MTLVFKANCCSHAFSVDFGIIALTPEFLRLLTVRRALAREVAARPEGEDFAGLAFADVSPEWCGWQEDFEDVLEGLDEVGWLRLPGQPFATVPRVPVERDLMWVTPAAFRLMCFCRHTDIPVRSDAIPFDDILTPAPCGRQQTGGTP